ncbi:hypothetical protein Ae201684_000432 [Aphanomyces euteiches]|uniref:Uncharacterized protein n=1 Tax=Aphanomyces euteiches TaxID=100861 RepID=A0A6G0XXF0_9STRA|nr:hypothetical protein Ae201684_000432 [Aphanomyces euteiches]
MFGQSRLVGAFSNLRPTHRLTTPRPTMSQQASTSCVQCKQHPRYRLMYTDEGIKSRSDDVLRNTISLATHEERSCNAMLAHKAMKYRKRDQNHINCEDPNVDVFECMGVQWCKVGVEG